MSDIAPDAAAPGPTISGSPTQPGAGERSVTVQGPNFGPITTGDRSPITITELGPLRAVADVPATAGPVGVPGHVPLFTGREVELAALGRALEAGPGAVVHAVHGLGGIGKSALAARYALLHAGEYTQVVWITAEDPVELEAGLRRFALALEPHLDQALASEALAERATAWLGAHDGWLLILDNVTSAGDIGSLLGRLSLSTGRFLVTSRTAVGWQRLGAQTMRLDVLEPAQALNLLAKTIGPTAQGTEGGVELCAYLGFLPLAIVQAGAYIAQNQDGAGSGVRWYLRLLARAPAAAFACGDEQMDPQQTLARIWRVTLDKLASTPLAGEVLRILAWFAPDAIPAALLQGPQPGLNEAIGRLAAYNLVTRTVGDPVSLGQGPGLAVHRLVQAVTRTPDPYDPHRTPDAITRARDTATTLLDTAMPGVPEDIATWSAWRRLVPHIDALAEYATPDTDTDITARLLNQAGRFLHAQGAVDRATNNFARAHHAYARVLGEDHPDTLGTRNNLASAYESAGDLGRAIPLYEAGLTDSIRVRGKDHPGTLTSRNNLAYAYQAAGDLGRAIRLYEATLADFNRVLGKDHPHTLSSRHNLAYAYECAGDLERAIPLYEAIVADFNRVLGEDHPRTLTSRNNLAVAYQTAGDLQQAIPLYEAALTDSIRVLGNEHQLVLSVSNNLNVALNIAQTGSST